MAALTTEQGQTIIQAGFELLKTASDLTSGRDPNYIRDAQPGNLVDTVALAAARQGCRRYADKGGNYPPRRAARLERACRPYLDSLNYNEPPQLAQPLLGGQCAGVTYTVSYQLRRQFSGVWQYTATNTVSVLGPVQIKNQAPMDVSCTPSSGLRPANAAIFDGNNVLRQGLANLCVDELPGYKIISVVPQSGGANNCGNPPPQYQPPSLPPAPDPPGPIVFAPGPGISVPIDVTVNIDGSLTVNIGTGPVTIDPFDEPEPTGGGGGGGDPGDPTDPGSPGSPVGTGLGGEAEGQAPAGQELVGVLVTVATAPGDANKFANNPKQPFRGIGYVRMGYPGCLGLDISGGTVISPQFFHAQQRGLTNWSVAANTGFNLTIQPYFRSIET